MKKEITAFISDFVTEYSLGDSARTAWQKPLTAVADARDPLFARLKKIVSPSHALPQEIIPGARSVLVFILPFQPDLGKSNEYGRYASREWVVAYEETNRMIGEINRALHRHLTPQNIQTSLLPATHNFDRKKLVSDWSHRHVAYIAGLGKFGRNNMLITDKGCCGRIGSIILDLELEPTPIPEGENCLYKYNGSCQKCVEHCVNDALREEGFDRFKCHEMCIQNDLRHPDLGKTEVCGKCVVAVPCSHRNPVRSKI